MQPSVSVPIQDGSLGIQPPSQGDILAVVGPAPSGPLATPRMFARSADAVALFGGSSPMVEAGAATIKRTGKPVLFVRTAASVAAVIGAVTKTGTGTFNPVVDSLTVPYDDHEVYVQFTTDGGVGTAGIKYQTSLDGGRTLSAVAALGTATSITVPTAAGLIKINLEPDDDALVALANDIRTKFLAHIVLITGSVHLNADTTSDDGVAAAATNRATAIALLNTLRTAYEAHRVLVGTGPSQVHLVADTTNTITAPAATDGFTARTLANELKAKLTAHEGDTASHTIADATNLVTVADVAVGSVVAGDYFAFRVTAATWNSSDLDTALTALKNTQQTWDGALMVGAAGSSTFDTVDTWLAGMAEKNKFRRAIMNTRIPNEGESEGDYLDAMTTIFGTKSSRWINLCFGSDKMISALTARSYRRPVSWRVAIEEILVDAAQDLAAVAKGPLDGIQIADDAGNPDDHDETIFPGADDARFTTLRSFDGRPGVFINNGRIFAPVGSDFIFVQFRRIMNLGARALVSYLEERLSAAIGIDPKTGFIAESTAAELEAGGQQAMAAVLMPFGRAAAVSFVVSRTDNILSTFTITGEARIVPNGYAKFFSVPIGFNNPALRTFQAAA